jgi:precorrin-2 dehydrogenase
MKTYPAMLRVHGRRVVVVGGGKIGMRRAAVLRDAGANVRQVAMGGTEPELEGVCLIREHYRPEHLQDAVIVLACTDDPTLNSQIASDARKMGAWVNVADQPEDCDFYLPAVAGEGDVIVAVGTGGSAPGLASRLRDRMADAIPAKIGEFAAALSSLRSSLRSQGTGGPERMRIMKILSGEEGYRLFIEGGASALRRRMESMIRGKELEADPGS